MSMEHELGAPDSTSAGHVPGASRIILASASPRRKQLLEDAGVDFEVVVSQADKNLPAREWADPARAVQTLAERKAHAVVASLPAVQEPTKVIGADTIVMLDGQVYGKPADEQDARRMIGSMAGRAHQVLTGVSIWTLEPTTPRNEALHTTFVEVSHVFFKPLTSQDIDEYLACGESLDKAGAYAIQGAGHVLVDHYEGDYDNIVGLPVARLLAVLEELDA